MPVVRRLSSCEPPVLGYRFRANDFPDGVVLSTGTGTVPSCPSRWPKATSYGSRLPALAS